MKRIAVYPGTFDPVTNGHIDLLQRSLLVFDRVVVGIAANPKKKPLFSLEERIQMFREALRGYRGARNVAIEGFDCLLVNYAREKKATGIIRGLRAVSDFEYELQMALMNRLLDSGVETVFLMPSEEYSFLTSTIVKEVASYGGDVSSLVPAAVGKRLKKKFGN